MNLLKSRGIFYPIFLVFILMLVILIVYAYGPVSSDRKTILIEIPRGTKFFQIVNLLDEAGLVNNRPLFCVLVIAKGAARKIRAGEYEFSTSMSPLEIIEKLLVGDIKKYRITVPEDLSLKEIAARLAAEGLVDESTFLYWAYNREFISSLGVEANSIEGYLFPDTYFFDRSMTARDIIRTMVKQFWKVATPALRQRAERMGMSVHEWVTLASIIGKETSYSAEKPLVSAVFHNRMKRGMKLQSDPTAVYNIDFNGVITKTHLLLDHPYNTYRIYGLPPGPIANPGRDSLLAALYPAKVDYLYFVSNGNGSHRFSSTLEDHNLAVQNYRSQRK
ncbi:MAG: endolytic transglycosylase MltG [Syntrophales bacterium]|nr:endolytic transglycosylase MltG [Syntrophales bacterium]